MPRGTKVVVEPVVILQPTLPVSKQRKPRTTDFESRIALADGKIAQLTSLVASRKALLQSTEALADKRRDALSKTEALLQSYQAKKARILASHEKNANAVSNAGKRSTKAAEKAELAALLEAVKASGKRVDEIIAALKG